jgi:hypothetical protein
MTRTQLAVRLTNYGYWLLHDAEITPDGARCVSLESRYKGEAGDVFERVDVMPTPNVSDAEELHILIRMLDCMSQYCLVARIMEMIGQPSEYPAVFRMRRVGDHAMKKMADNAEVFLYEALKKRA